MQILKPSNSLFRNVHFWTLIMKDLQSMGGRGLPDAVFQNAAMFTKSLFAQGLLGIKET